MTHILIVEDEITLAKEISNYLIDSNYNCAITHTYKDALKILGEKGFTVILLDLKLPDGNGLQLIQYLKKKKITSGIIVLSANDELNIRILALDAGADALRAASVFHFGTHRIVDLKGYLEKHNYPVRNVAVT